MRLKYKRFFFEQKYVQFLSFIYNYIFDYKNGLNISSRLKLLSYSKSHFNVREFFLPVCLFLKFFDRHLYNLNK